MECNAVEEAKSIVPDVVCVIPALMRCLFCGNVFCQAYRLRCFELGVVL